MSRNSIVSFWEDYLINSLTRPFLLDTNDIKNRNIDFMEYLSDEKDVVIRLKLIPNYEFETLLLGFLIVYK